jgi:hypothetical protein
LHVENFTQRREDARKFFKARGAGIFAVGEQKKAAAPCFNGRKKLAGKCSLLASLGFGRVSGRTERNRTLRVSEWLPTVRNPAGNRRCRRGSLRFILKKWFDWVCLGSFWPFWRGAKTRFGPRPAEKISERGTPVRKSRMSDRVY